MSARTSRIDRTAPAPEAESAPGPVDLSPLEGLLGYHLRRAQLAAFQSFAQATSGEAISPGQFGVLLLLRANVGINQTQLGGALGIDRSTLVAVLDRLEQRGLLARQRAVHDRRSHALSLTPAGEAFLDGLIQRVQGHEADLARNLTAAETRQLIALLRRVSGP